MGIGVAVPVETGRGVTVAVRGNRVAVTGTFGVNGWVVWLGVAVTRATTAAVGVSGS
jgi:hypothetical protein